MAELQEEINAKTFALGTKGVRFTEDMLKTLVRQGLRMLDKSAHTNHETKDNRTLIEVGELTAKSRGAVSSLTVADSDVFHQTMKDWGLQYAIKEMPVLDEKGKQIFADEKGKPVTLGVNDLGEKTFFDEKGKQIDKDKVYPLKEFVVFFDSRHTDVLTNAFKDYQKRCSEKAERAEKKPERENIKEKIEKNKEKMKEVNKDNPEKHHNRGEQSL
ncbi:MAG: hypothetical protein J6N47_02200 [Lachnospiraceae bacterium]|nr:hypothetical protein [Lachnospiraceae bacterium]